MIPLRDATEAEMIAAFLRAEIDSTRYEHRVLEALKHFGRGRKLVDIPDCTNTAANEARKAVLTRYRGYPDTALFGGFPTDVMWSYVSLEPQDFNRMRYINDVRTPDRHWDRLTGGTRLVTEGARNFVQSQPLALAHIAKVLAVLRSGRAFLPLVVAEDLDGSLILIEGHSRATAYVIDAKTAGVEAFVGRSPSLSRWDYY